MSNRSLRWGLMSTAAINERMIPAIRNSGRSSVVAVASRSREKAESHAAKWGIPRAYAGYEALLKDPEVDVIYISLPNSSHKEWSVRSADAGKHVLCEKPLALTTDEVDQMATAAERNGVIIQEAAMYRCHPQTFRVLELVREGSIGELLMIQGVHNFTLDIEHDFRWDPKLGGGSLWDMGIYLVSFARIIVGAEPLEVMGWQVLSKSGVDLNFAGQMRFPGGVITQLISSFETTAETELVLLGREGVIHLDLPFMNRPGIPGHVRVIRYGAPTEGTFGDEPSSVDTKTITFGGDSYQCQVEALAASVLDGAPVVLPLSESRGNTAATVALYESAEKNVPVTLPAQAAH